MKTWKWILIVLCCLLVWAEDLRRVSAHKFPLAILSELSQTRQAVLFRMRPSP